MGARQDVTVLRTLPSGSMIVLNLEFLLGLQKRGSFITSVKNPSSRGPANASLPKAAEFPQELVILGL